MKNPYKSQSLTGHSRRSRIGYVWALVLAFPVYVCWQLSRLVPEWLGGVVRGCLGFLRAPFSQLLYFAKRWLVSRPWGKLLWASPLLLAMISIQSVIFLTKSRSDEEIFADYRSNLLAAMGAKDYDLADYLAGKLIGKAAFARDEQMLFAAMIAAHQAENISRRDMLIERLTGELQHVGAHLWYARYLLATGNGQHNRFQEALPHVLAAMKLSDDPAPIRIELARMCHHANRSKMGVDLLEELPDPDPATSMLLAKLCASTGMTQRARGVAKGLLQRLDTENPQKDRYIQERIDAFTLLADSQNGTADVVEGLLKIAARLENKAILAPDDELIKSQLTHAYMVVGNVLSHQVDEQSRSKALVYFQKSVAQGRIPYVMGKLILNVSGLNNDGGLPQQQVRNALVRGDGPAMAHLLLGLDAWKSGLGEEAALHIRLAHALEPNSLRAVEYVMMNVAKLPSDANAHPFRMSLDVNPLWRRSLLLLDIVSGIDEKRHESSLYGKCFILAQMQRWKEVVDLALPHVPDASAGYRADFLNLLARAYAALGDSVKALEYSKKFQAEQIRIWEGGLGGGRQ